MDPTATHRLIVDAIAANEWEDATEHCRNLWNWIQSGGFIGKNMQHIPMEDIPTVYEEPTAAGLRHLVAGLNREFSYVYNH